MRRSTLVLAAALLALGVGCGRGADPDASERMTVRGTVAQLSVGQGARAVAVGADGRAVWANLDAHGDFSLRLPLGQSYRIVIANPRRAAGHLALAKGATTTRWLAARTTTTIDLGRLSPTTTSTTTASAGLRTQSAGELEGPEQEDAGEHEDDAESHDGDEKEVCSGGASDVELRASSEPGEDAKDDAEHDDHDDDCGEHESEGEDEAEDD